MRDDEVIARLRARPRVAPPATEELLARWPERVGGAWGVVPELRYVAAALVVVALAGTRLPPTTEGAALGDGVVSRTAALLDAVRARLGGAAPIAPEAGPPGEDH